MKKIQNWLEKYLAPFATKISASNSMNAISKGFSSILPVTMIGSLVTLLLYINYFGFQEFLVNVGIKPYINLIVNLTTNAISIYLVVAVSIAKARTDYEDGEARVISFLSLMSFLLLCPLAEDGNIQLGWMGSKGMFTALIVGLFIPSMYRFITDNGLAIKLPDSVPPFIADSFKAIVPGFVFAFICCTIDYALKSVGLGSLPEAIMMALAKPFEVLTGSIFTWLLLTFASNLFWFFGIHGGMIVGSFTNILFSQATLENIAAASAGEALPHILTTGFLSACGASYNLALCVVLIWMTKRKDLKAIGKLSITPALFNISEPLRYGLPTILNVHLMVPALFILPINNLLTYLVIAAGLVSRPRIASVFGTPVFLDAFTVCGFSGLVWSIILFLLNILLWYPFIKIYENAKNKEDEKGLIIDN